MLRAPFGRLANAKTVAQALKLSGSFTVRVVRPGVPISMDYGADRITIEIDESNEVVRLTCG